MTERPPNEVAAALRDTWPALSKGEVEALRLEGAEAIDRLIRERDEARVSRDAYMNSGYENAARLMDDCNAMQKRAETAERELSEARAALAIDEAGMDKMEATMKVLAEQRDLAHDIALEAEAAYREHAEAIVVLREAAAKVAQDYAIDHAEDHGTPAVAHNAAMNIRDAIRAIPIPEVAPQVERERRAEREVVRAAVAYKKAVDTGTFTDEGRKLYEALAALPASPPETVIDK